MQIPTQSIKVLSLFSGMGAPERALEKLGIPFEIEAWSEIDKYAKKAYAILHCDGDESKNLGDITKIDELDLLDLEDVDLITYGFPCQDISLAGLGKGLWEIDALTGERVKTRSGLVWDAHRIIGEVLPKVAICENVKNLTSKKFANEFQAILNSLEDLGYNNYWQVLNAKNYGVPQNRERIFIVSIRKDVDDGSFKFPEPMPLKLRLKDVLDTDVDEKYFISTKGIKYICSPKRGVATDVNAEVAQPLTAKGQQNWTGSFVSPNIDHLEKSSEIGGDNPVTIKMKDGEELVEYKEPKYRHHFHFLYSDYEMLNMMLNLDSELKDAYELYHEYIRFNNTDYNNPIDSLNDLNEIINDFILSNIEEFIKLADMFNNWKAEIVNSFAKVNGTRVSNGPIEGRNSLIKKILKVANGYSNFKRFRNRVIYCLNTLAKHNFISQ